MLSRPGVPSSARAQATSPTTPRADPEALFNEATALFEQQRYAEALPKFEAAQRVDPGIGTQFNIAVCYERLGKLASAQKNFETVLHLAKASGKKQREDAARVRLEALAPKLSGFVITSDEPDVILKVDGNVINRQAWTFLPTDPGEHTIEATAATKRPWSATITTPPEGQRKSVVVPRLLTVEGKTVTVTQTDTRRTIGYALGGVGLVGAAGAVVTGLMLLEARSEASKRCTPKCVDSAGNFDQSGVDAVNRGETLLPINAISWGVMIVGLGAGAYFVLTSGKKNDGAPSRAAATSPSSLVAVPFFTSSGGGVGATGRF